MSGFEFRLPDIGEGVTEGEIVKWLIAPGDVVREDQPMVEVMTDKATVTITSPRSGKIAETRGGVGSIVPVHNVLVVYEGAVGASATPIHPTTKADAASGPAATAVGDIREDLPGMNLIQPAPTLAQQVPAAKGGYFNERPLATPGTRKLARDHGVDLSQVQPTGNGGRVTKPDVEAIVASKTTTDVPDGARASVADASSRGVSTAARGPLVEDERIPLRGLRRRIFVVHPDHRLPRLLFFILRRKNSVGGFCGAVLDRLVDAGLR